MTDNFVCRVANTEEWIDRIARLRVEVWNFHNMIDMKYFPDGKWLEDVDKIATHIIIEVEGKLVAATRYVQFENIDSSHLAEQYRESGLSLPGAIGIPERAVVHPDYLGHGLFNILSKASLEQAIEQGACYTIVEATTASAKRLADKRVSMGKAPADPRLPGSEWEYMVADVKEIVKNRKS